MKKEYLERIYAGWLAKIIGIRYGAPVEGWTYEKIKNIYNYLLSYLKSVIYYRGKNRYSTACTLQVKR